MHPLAEGGAAIQNLFILFHHYNCGEVSDIEANNLYKHFKLTWLELIASKRFTEMSEIPHPATKLYSSVPSLLATNIGKNIKFLPVTNGTNKCNTCRYTQDIIVLILSFFLISRYNFSTFSGDKAVDSCQGAAGTRGYTVSTLVRTGHWVHPVRLYTACNRGVYSRTSSYIQNGIFTKRRDFCQFFSRLFMFCFKSSLSDYKNWSTVKVFTCFRVYFFAISELPRVKKVIVHRWVSTGLSILGR